MITDSPTKWITVTNSSTRPTHLSVLSGSVNEEQLRLRRQRQVAMVAAKINWHRYGAKLRYCHPMYEVGAKIQQGKGRFVRPTVKYMNNRCEPKLFGR